MILNHSPFRILFLSSFLLLIKLNAVATPPTLPIGSFEYKSLEATQAQEILTYLNDLQTEFKIGTVALTILQEEDVLCEHIETLPESKAFNKDTSFPASDLSEAFSSLFLVSKMQSKRFSWNTPAQKLWRKFDFGNYTKDIELQHFLHMTAGVPGHLDELFENDLGSDDIFGILKQTISLAPPGKELTDSSLSLAAAYYLSIGIKSGAYTLSSRYSSVIKKELIDRIGMTNTNFDPNAAFTPISGMSTSMHDLALWLRAELDKGISGDGSLLADRSNVEKRWEIFNQNGNRMRGYGWIVSNYRNIPIVAKAGTSENATVAIGLIPAINLGFALYIGSADEKIGKIIEEIPLAIIEFSKIKQ